MSDFRKAVQTVDDLMKALQQEDLTNEEYKDLQMKFQVNFCFFFFFYIIMNTLILRFQNNHSY